MARLSARSNPTGLREIDRNRVTLSLSEAGGRRAFVLERLDLKDTGISETLKVVVIARAGNSSARFEMGTAGEHARGAQVLDGLDLSHPLRFRILLHEADSPKLVGSVENLRARDESQSESLLPMEPAQLAERLWRLVITEDGPVLQFNSMVFPSAAGAENFVPFSALVLPEALRQVMQKIAEDPACLEDEDSPWRPWAAWLDAISAARPPGGDDEEDSSVWCDDVVDRFCARCRFATSLQSELLKGAGA
jgi:hypothetical protein